MPLRPLDLGDLYDVAITTIQSNPRTMVGIPALATTSLSVLTFLPGLLGLHVLVTLPTSDAGQDTATNLFLLSGGSVLSGVMTWLTLQIVIGMLVIAVGAAAFGRTMGPGPLWSGIRHRLPGVLGLGLVLSLVPFIFIVVPLALSILLLQLASPVPGIVVGILGGALGLAATTALITRWSMAFPAMILENLGIRAALDRSRNLIRGHSLRVLGILLLTLIIIQVIGVMLFLPFSLISMVLLLAVDTPAIWPLVLSQSLVTVGEIVTATILFAFIAATTTVLYLDLRMRQEGLDVELMSAPGERR